MCVTLRRVLLWAFACIGLRGAMRLIWRGRRKTNLKGSTVVITGGSEGIGKEVAAEAVRQGAGAVVLLARNADKLLRAATELSGVGESEIVVAPCDACDPVAVSAAFASIRKRFGMVDVLVNCAGACICDNFEALTPEEMKSQVEVNLLAPMYCTQQVIPFMKTNGKGTVVLMLSQGAQVGLYGFTAYSASKFGLRGFAESLAMELVDSDVNVVCCFPAATETPGYEMENVKKPEATRRIEATSGVYSASDVGQRVLDAVREGDARVTFGATGWLLSALTAGCAPACGWISTAAELAVAGAIRLFALGMLTFWKFQIISDKEQRWRAEKRVLRQEEERLEKEAKFRAAGAAFLYE